MRLSTWTATTCSPAKTWCFDVTIVRVESATPEEINMVTRTHEKVCRQDPDKPTETGRVLPTWAGQVWSSSKNACPLLLLLENAEQ